MSKIDQNKIVIPGIKRQPKEKPDMKTRAAVRRLVQIVAENIDPDVTVERIKIGEKE